jgi:hypothetical protein
MELTRHMGHRWINTMVTVLPILRLQLDQAGLLTHLLLGRPILRCLRMRLVGDHQEAMVAKGCHTPMYHGAYLRMVTIANLTISQNVRGRDMGRPQEVLQMKTASGKIKTLHPHPKAAQSAAVSRR